MNSHIGTFKQMQILRVGNEVQWNAKLFCDYCQFLRCELNISNTRNPECNSLVEQAIKNIKLAFYRQTKSPKLGILCWNRI